MRGISAEPCINKKVIKNFYWFLTLDILSESEEIFIRQRVSYETL